MREPKIDRPVTLQNQFILVPYYLEKAAPHINTLLQGAQAILADRPLAGDPQHDLPAIHRPLKQRVAAIAAAGERPISLAGDCLTAAAIEAGLHAQGIEPLVIWFDAHGDFNTWETTPSGFIGGMPLAMLVGLGEQTYLQALELPPIPGARVILAGARDLDPGERENLAASAVQQFPQIGALLDYAWPDRPIHVHFDVDVLDPSDAPAVDYPSPGGPSAAELEAVFRSIAATGKLAAVSMAAWNPALDADGRTRRTCLRLLSVLIGQEL
jgi:arginase